MENVMSKFNSNGAYAKNNLDVFRLNGPIPKSRPASSFDDTNLNFRGFSNNSASKGGVAATASGAALGALAATDMSGVNEGHSEKSNAVDTLISGIRNLSSDNSGVSVEHLKAPLNAAITGWLQSNAPLVNDFFAITGKQPTDMVDTIVSAFRNRNAGASIGTVDDTMMSIIETAKERVALKDDRFEFQPGYEGKVRDTIGSREQWENIATAVATLQMASDALPGGIRALLAIREALEMEKGFFNEVFTRLYGYDPEEYLGGVIDNYQSRVSLGIR